MQHYGGILEDIMKWSEVAWQNEPSNKRVKMIEALLRATEAAGRANPHMHSHVVDKYFWDLPAELRATLKDYMEHGVKTHIPQAKRTEPTKPSKTALDNDQSVWKHLRRFTANGWVRAFPASCLAIWMQCGLLMHSTHFVESNGDKKER